jgi:hypothetical protein
MRLWRDDADAFILLLIALAAAVAGEVPQTWEAAS